jgi:hypothetical protein
MSRVYITVDEGSDTASYHTDEPVTYQSLPIPSQVEGEPDGRLVFCVFVPLNGHAKGKLLRVPFARIVSVAENKP